MIHAPVTYIDPDDLPWTAAHRPAADALRTIGAITKEIARSIRSRVNHSRTLGTVTPAEYWNRHDTTESTS